MIKRQIVLTGFLLLSVICRWDAVAAPKQSATKAGTVCPYFHSLVPALAQARSHQFEIPGIYKESGTVPGILVEDSPPNECTLTLILAPGCPGATACSTGHYHADSNQSPGEYRSDDDQEIPVTLAKGIRGYFYDAAKYCMTGCDSRITWQQGKTVFQVGYKYGTLAQVRKMANDLILGKALSRRPQP